MDEGARPSGTGSRNKSRSCEEAAPCNQATTRLQSEEVHVRVRGARRWDEDPPEITAIIAIKVRSSRCLLNLIGNQREVERDTLSVVERDERK